MIDGARYPITWSQGNGGFGAARRPGSESGTVAPTLVACAGRVLFGDYPISKAYLGSAQAARLFVHRSRIRPLRLGRGELRVLKTFIMVLSELGVFGLTVWAGLIDDLGQ
jgi:hypothetical protein